MDVSDDYIKMCQGASELQENWSPQVDDCVHIEGEGVCSILFYSPEYETPSVWIPKQDQLQDLLEDCNCYYNPKFCMLFDEIRHLINSIQPEKARLLGYFDTFKTDEQLWLAFVMWKRYCKVWSWAEYKWKRGHPNGN